MMVYNPPMTAVNGMTVTSVEVQQEHIPYTLMHDTYKPDVRWTFTDHRGHVHTYSHEADPWPTLVQRSITHTAYDDGYVEEWGESWWQCRKCHQVIKPGMVVDKVANVQYHMPGMTEVSVSGVCDAFALERWREPFEITHGPWTFTVHPMTIESITGIGNDVTATWSGYGIPRASPL